MIHKLTHIIKSVGVVFREVRAAFVTDVCKTNEAQIEHRSPAAGNRAHDNIHDGITLSMCHENTRKFWFPVLKVR